MILNFFPDVSKNETKYGWFQQRFIYCFKQIKKNKVDEKMRKKILALGAIFIIICTSVAAAYGINKNNCNNENCQKTTDPTDEEIQGLLFMREEEKLARDVYLTLYVKWNGLIIFQNIAQSEQRHMDSIKNLLDKYGLDDPAQGNDVGEFTNQELQNLYYDLISEGEQSLINALTVGGKIEELDIIDLKEYIEQTDKLDIKRVYSNLLEGSKNHLRAFVKELENQGVNYKPFYLSQEEFEDIINGNGGSISRKQNNQNQLNNGQNQQPRLRTRIRNMIENIIKICNGERNILRNRNWR